MSLRRRLVAAFVLVAVPPLALLVLAVAGPISTTFEATASRQLESALASAQARIADLRREAQARVDAVARVDLPAASGGAGERELADGLARRRDLPALEILNAEGQVVSSHHWPAGFGLPESETPVAGDESLRWETVAEGYGAARRLATMASQTATLHGARVTVRGGFFLDREFLAELASLLKLEIGLRDTSENRWIPATGALAMWADPLVGRSASRPPIELAGRRYLWAAAPLAPTLWLAVAAPTSELDWMTQRVRLAGLLAGGVALLGALAAALLLSGRIARPVRDLVAGAERVAGGDLTNRVPITTTDEIGELAQAFNRMTDDLRASRLQLVQAERAAAWREMARRLAHELKNPLFPIQLSIETLGRTLERGDPDFERLFRESSQTILHELEALRRIVDEFSACARLPAPRLRPTDCNDVVRQVLALYETRATTAGVETALSPSLPPVSADPELLGRALSNLVKNALEAMPEGGTLRISTAAQDGSVTVTVADTGPGLTEEQRTHLFTPYFTTKPGGTGLGLAIVQGIVSDHRGRVEVESEPGGRTTFRVVLPAIKS